MQKAVRDIYLNYTNYYMKKALTFLTIISASVSTVFAQVSIGIGATQGQVNGGALLQLLALAQTIVTRLVPFAVGLAVLAFFWYLIEFIWKGAADPAKRQESLKGMGFAVLALFVMVSIWGIVGFAGSLLGIGQGGTVPIPGIPTP